MVIGEILTNHSDMGVSNKENIVKKLNKAQKKQLKKFCTQHNVRMEQIKQKTVEDKVNCWRATPGLSYDQIAEDEDYCGEIEEFFFKKYKILATENLKRCLKSHPNDWKQLTDEYNSSQLLPSDELNETLIHKTITDALEEAEQLALIKMQQYFSSK
jgi:hypothetical protein